MGSERSVAATRGEGRRLTLFHEALLSGFARRGDKAALVDATSGRTISYADLPGAVERVAAALRASGLRNGEVVGLLGRNVPEYLPTLLGILAAGGVVAPVNPHFLPHEAAVQLVGSRASRIIAQESLLPNALVAASGAGIPVLAADDGACALREVAHGGAVRSRTIEGGAPGDALLAWSVGPGGFPAPARLSHTALAAALVGLAAVVPWREDDIVYTVISPYDLYGMVSTLALALHCGMTAVTATRFDARSFAQAVRTFGATVSNVVPSIVRVLAESPAVPDGFAPLRLLISGGAPLAPHVCTACSERLGIPVIQGFGLAEAAGATHVDAPVGDALGATCGRPIAGLTARVVAGSGRVVPAGGVGELWVRGPQLFSGYLGNDGKSAEALTPDGWLRTGDLASADETGRVTILGRQKRLVKVKGFQVSPAEVEAALVEHPRVSAAAVVPTWDLLSGEENARAFVVTRGGVEPAEIQRWVADRVARHKRPATVEVVSELPPGGGPWFFPWAADNGARD